MLSALEKILENELVAQFCHVRDPDDVLRKLRPALHGDAVTSLGNIRPGNGGAVDIRMFVFQKVSANARPALFVLAETNVGLEAESETAPVSVIQPEYRLDVVGERHGNAPQDRWSPRAEIGGRNHVAKGIVQRLVKIGPPEDRDVAHVEGHVLENDAVLLVNAHRFRLEPKIRLVRVMRGERAFGNKERTFGDRGHLFPRHEIRLLVRLDIDRPDLLGLGVINRALADERPEGAINPDVSFGDDIVGLGIVGGLVRVDVRVARVNGYVAVGGGETVLIIGIARGGDFERLLLRADLSERGCAGAKQP